MERYKGKRMEAYVADYIVFDLETTGISSVNDAIIEVSAIKVRDHVITEEFSTLVNPERRIPPAATAVNGITNEMVAKAPTIEIVMTDFLAFVGADILVGHNIHTFDMNFAYDAAWNAMERKFQNDYIDTLYMARKCLPQLSHHKLTDVAAYFAISTKGAHRALNDCIMNQSCYEQMGGILNNLPMIAQPVKKSSGHVCPTCGSELNERNGKFGAFYGCSSYPRCKFTKRIG